MKKHAVKSVFAVAVALGATGVAKADLNINGATGLFLNPTAEVVQKGQPRVQVNYYDLGTDYDDSFYGVYGAIAPGDKWEISGGINRFHVGQSDWSDWDRNGFAVGAKYQIYNDRQKGLQVAVGAGYDRGLLDNIHAYAAATQTWRAKPNRAPIKGTLGVRADRFTDIRIDESDEYASKISAFAGIEVPLSRDGSIRLIGEIQSKNTDGTFGSGHTFPYSLGLRYQPDARPFSVSVGYARQGINTPHETNPKVFVQAGYTFGK